LRNRRSPKDKDSKDGSKHKNNEIGNSLIDFFIRLHENKNARMLKRIATSFSPPCSNKLDFSNK
jgi:hypothetical protein